MLLILFPHLKHSALLALLGSCGVVTISPSPLAPMMVYCLAFFLFLSLGGVDAAASSLFWCLFEATAASNSGKDLPEPGLGLSLSVVFGTSVSSLAFICNYAGNLF